ncbi:hypothetical protein GF373_17435 [bacterium]|nr:hypothetical protein [bacterium]
MAKITKHVDRAIPSTQRTQYFTSADASQGDILMVASSLGHDASYLEIEAAGNLTLRFNVIHTVYPNRNLDPFFANGLGGWKNVTLGKEIIASGIAEVVLTSGETYTLDKTISISDIQLATATGDFNIFVA